MQGWGWVPHLRALCTIRIFSYEKTTNCAKMAVHEGEGFGKSIRAASCRHLESVFSSYLAYYCVFTFVVIYHVSCTGGYNL